MTETATATMNTVKAARHAVKYTGKICVKFPTSDYMVGGRVWSGEPIRHLKPTFSNGAVIVRFNNALWQLCATLWTVNQYNEATREFTPMRRANGSRYRAQISFNPIHIKWLN